MLWFFYYKNFVNKVNLIYFIKHKPYFLLKRSKLSKMLSIGHQEGVDLTVLHLDHI